MKIKLLFAAFVMTFLIAGTNLAAKAATLEIHPSVVIFFRYVIALMSIKIILLVKKRSIYIDKRDKKSFFLLTVSGILLNQIFFVWGLKYTVPSHPSLLYATTSFWVILMLWMIKKQSPGRRQLFSAFIALSGVALVLGKNIFVLNANILKGDLILIGAVISWAIYTAFGRDMVQKYGALELTYILLGFGTAVYMPFGIYSVSQLQVELISASAWLGVLYMGIFTSAVSYILYYFLLQHLSPISLSLLIAAQPPTTILLSIGAGYEQFSFNILIGTALVILAIFISSYKSMIKGVQNG